MSEAHQITVESLAEIVAQLRADLAATRAQVAALQAASDADTPDGALIAAIARATLDERDPRGAPRLFTCSELITDAEIRSPFLLAAILRAATKPNPRSLGKKLASLEGRMFGRYCLKRLAPSRSGEIWQVQIAAGFASQTR